MQLYDIMMIFSRVVKQRKGNQMLYLILGSCNPWQPQEILDNKLVFL